VISFVLNLKVYKSFLFIFLIGCLIRTIPELVAYPYPIGYDTINYYIPLANEIEFDLLKDHFNILPYLIFILKISTLAPHNLMIVLSTITYGIFSTSVYLLLRVLNLKYEWLATLFILFQIPALRTTWDLQKDILALSFTFFILSLVILKDRKLSLPHNKESEFIFFILIITLVILTVLTDTMISFLLIISLFIYFIIKKDKKYVVYFGVIILVIVISLLFLISDKNNSQISRNINTILNNTIKENVHYSPLNLFLLFIMMNGLLLPFLFHGIKHIRQILLYIPLILTLVGSFTWIVLPYSSILLPDRWIILSGIFISIFSSYGLIKLFLPSSLLSYSFLSNNKNNKINRRILVISILFVYIVIGLFYMILPTSQTFPMYSLFSAFTQNFVPTTMQFNSIDILDNEDLIMVIDWLNNNTASDSIIYGDLHFRGWMETLLKDQRTFKFTNNMNYTKNGIYIILANNINLINSPVKLLFSQGTFKIIEK
jgi:hypothetical protein